MSQSLHIICYGNMWRGDDGFGIHVYRALSDLSLPPALRVFEGGTRILDSLAFFENASRVLIVDALNNMGHPGKLHLLSPDRLQTDMVATSTHDFDIHSLLRLMPDVLESSAVPEIRILGAEVESIATFSESLSSSVRNAVPKAVELILNDLARMNT